MKIAFCLFKYFPYGGLQRDFLRIASECINRGWEVHVFTMQWQGEKQTGLIIHLLNAKGFTNHARCYYYAELLQKYLKQHQFDVVIGFNKLPMLDLYFASDVCYQSRCRNKSFLYRLQPRYKRFVQLEKAVFAAGNKTEIMLLSALQQKEYVDCYATENARFHFLPPGIARDRIAPANAHAIRMQMRQKCLIGDDEFLLLMVGSGFKTKGVDRSLYALAALPDELRKKCHLMIIGQDSAKPFLRLAKKLNISSQVTFAGGRDDVPAFLLAADVLLHPSYHENTGTVLLEALAAGLPVLTIDVCGYAHYIEEAKAGIVLASPFNPSEMKTALMHMLQSNERENWRDRALTFAKNADIYSMPLRALDIIESIGRKRDVLFA